MKVPIEQICEDYLAEAQVDYIFFTQICHDVRDHCASGPKGEYRIIVMEIIRGLLERGLRPLNFNGPGSKPVYWEIDDVDKILDRISLEWISLPDDPDIMAICWFGLKGAF